MTKIANDETALTKQEAKAIDKVISSNALTELTYKLVLSKNPPKSIVKRHDFGKFNYLPITAVERLLDGLFTYWNVEILREGQVANGFYCAVRLRAKIPQSDLVMVSDGIGFAEFQTSKGSAPTDLSKIIVGAGVMAIPRAKAEAVKNAAKSFGNLFGRNLARNDDNAVAEAEVVNYSRDKIKNTLEANNDKAD